MALQTGTRIGVYEVVGVLGAGGMGEVYRARDTRLKRDVALKILPESFADDPDHVARFHREARILASLNHPRIAAIYGFEESDGFQALVLELVEGDTLADRITRGALPLEDALSITSEIAEALEAAHDSGIIHRDLKPARAVCVCARPLYRGGCSHSHNPEVATADRRGRVRPVCVPSSRRPQQFGDSSREFVIHTRADGEQVRLYGAALRISNRASD